MIKLFVMDVDGTMTDGAVFLDGDGGEFLDNYLRVTRRAKSVVRRIFGGE